MYRTNWFSTCTHASSSAQFQYQVSVLPLPLPFIESKACNVSVWVYHHSTVEMFVTEESNTLICWNMHVFFPRWEQCSILDPTLICFGWRQLLIPRWQNECCHGNLLPGNPNSLATSQTVAMAQLSIYACWAGVSVVFCSSSLSKFSIKSMMDECICGGNLILRWLSGGGVCGWPIILPNKTVQKHWHPTLKFSCSILYFSTKF